MGIRLSRRQLLTTATGAALAGATLAPGARAAGAAAHKVHSARALKRALKSASGGETFALAAGDWADLRIEGLTFSTPVRLVPAEDPAVINRLSVEACKGLRFEGLKFQYVFERGTHWRDRPFRADESRDIRFTACLFNGAPGAGEVKKIDISGAPWANGPALRKSQDCHFLRCTSTGFRQGMVLTTVRGCSVSGCRLERHGNDNLRLIEVADVTVEDCYFGQADTHPDDPFHNDHIHHYNVNATTHSTGVRIRRNMLYSDRDALRDSAGMMLQSTPPNELHDWRIEENVFIGRAHHAISLWPVKGAVVRANTLIRWHRLGKDDQSAKEYHLDTPKILVRKGSSDVTVADNLMVVGLVKKGRPYNYDGNVAIAPEDYRQVFAMPNPDDPRSWKVRRDGPAAGKGSPLMWA